MKRVLEGRTNYRNEDVIDIIEHIASKSSKNDKIDILKIAIETNIDFRSVLIATYDTFYTYGIKDLSNIPSFRNTGAGFRPNGLATFCKKFLMGPLADAAGCDAGMKKQFSRQMSNLSVNDAKVVPLILKRSLDAGFNVSSINKACPGLIFKYPVMLCDKFNAKTIKNIQYPALAQVKCDGMRVNMFYEAGGIKLRSRNGKYIETLGSFDSVIKKFKRDDSFVLDGELLVHVEGDPNTFEPRRISNGICNKALKGTIEQKDADRLVYVVWDVVPFDRWKEGLYTTHYKYRLAALNKMVKGLERIQTVEYEIVKNFEEVQTYYKSKLDKGEEGIILKNISSNWEDKRAKHQLKFKVEATADMKIVGVTEGQGKYENMLGAFIVQSEDGAVTCSVGSGLTDAQRELYFSDNMIGKIAEMKYNEIISNKSDDTKSLFLPIFVGIREDKDVANTLAELK